MLHLETVLPDALALLKRIQAMPELSAMRLVGGTALALLLGHRKSIDLDFFGTFDSSIRFVDLLRERGFLAAANRGRKKDFVDMAFLLERYALADLLDHYMRKFSVREFSYALRGLTYFDDAEDEQMPVMLMPMSWDAVKKRISTAVRDYLTSPVEGNAEVDTP